MVKSVRGTSGGEKVSKRYVKSIEPIRLDYRLQGQSVVVTTPEGDKCDNIVMDVLDAVYACKNAHNDIASQRQLRTRLIPILLDWLRE